MTTTRTTDNSLYPGPVISQQYTYPGIWTDPVQASYRVKCMGSKKSITSVREGKFVPGVFRVNPVTISRLETQCVYGLMSIATKWAAPQDYLGQIGQKFNGPICANYYEEPAAPVWDANLEKLSNAKTFAKMYQAEDDLAMVLVELDETIHMLRNPLETFHKLLAGSKRDRSVLRRTLKREKLSRIGSTAKIDAAWERFQIAQKNKLAVLGADTWLLYRYGIMPCIIDAMTVLKSLNQMVDKTFDLRRVRDGAASNVEDLTQVQRTLGSFNYGTIVTRTKRIKSTTILYYRWNLFSKNQSWLDAHGIAWRNVLPAVWERIPFSFVVDWLVDVQDWIQALMPNPYLTYVGGCVSQKWEQSYSVSMLQPTFAPGSNIVKHTPDEFIPSTYKWKNTQLVRRTNPTVPLLPGLHPKVLNLKRSLDSIALVIGQIMKHVRR